VNYSERILAGRMHVIIDAVGASGAVMKFWSTDPPASCAAADPPGHPLAVIDLPERARPVVPFRPVLRPRGPLVLSARRASPDNRHRP
jgi:hypothetical protein